eukprot:gnl/Spiro4/14634_TR7880_c0_g1_i1.p1 gnl/Spiro4/14634_TR7880_c0_g1~~gnl/Spiro4/14634_TR7880_c0_g1_i1.p1  ORF type:complete len:168 (-),score=12.54 gnl/Spiro4/14634_TR7880_c0_g1_i1:72-575(-)
MSCHRRVTGKYPCAVHAASVLLWPFLFVLISCVCTIHACPVTYNRELCLPGTPARGAASRNSRCAFCKSGWMVVSGEKATLAVQRISNCAEVSTTSPRDRTLRLNEDLDISDSSSGADSVPLYKPTGSSVPRWDADAVLYCQCPAEISEHTAEPTMMVRVAPQPEDY